MSVTHELLRTVAREGGAATGPHETGDDTPPERHGPDATMPRAADDPPATGSRVGLYVPGFAVTGELARGGMGVVLAAIEAALNREVAIKMLLPGAAGADRAAQRFVAEARITARLQHPGIPPVHQVGTLPDGRPFLAMKLIRGRTLAAVLTARGQRPSSLSADELDLTALDSPGLLHVFEQICQAVGYAHAQGVIHRDLKPANVMVGSFGEVQVMDWGIARDQKDEGGRMKDEVENAGGSDSSSSFTIHPSSLTQAGQAMGTPQFMPPEQARGEWEAVDARADVFALGGILAAVLTGEPPYTGATTRAVLRRAEAGDLGDCFARLDDCCADPELIGLAKRCLAPAAADRPVNAGEVAQRLAAYRLGVEARLVAAEAERATAAARVEDARRRFAAERLAKCVAEERADEAEQYAAVVTATARDHARRRRGMFAAVVLTLLVLAGIYGEYRERRARGTLLPPEAIPAALRTAGELPTQEANADVRE